MAEKSGQTIVKVGGAPKRGHPSFLPPTLCILLAHTTNEALPSLSPDPEPKHGVAVNEAGIVRIVASKLRG